MVLKIVVLLLTFVANFKNHNKIYGEEQKAISFGRVKSYLFSGALLSNFAAAEVDENA